MVVTTDLADIKNVHPKNKFDVGNRLALWALAKAYGKKDLVYSGPLYKSMKVEGRKIRLSFSHVGGGLKSRDGRPLSEFQIAGADGKFVPAEATIDGNTVVVQAREVTSPTQVRFGWRNVASPNLVNKEGLPASPFQTNDWQGGTGDPLPKALGSRKAVDAKAANPPKIAYTGDGSDLQAVIDAAPLGATVICDAKRSLKISKAITIRRPLTLRGLHARLPKKLGRTPILVVAAAGVTLSDLELHGNYDSVSQDDCTPLIHVRKGRFTIERCVFYDASKDGVMVTPGRSDGDIVDVVVRKIEAYRMGRDAVSIAGGDRGQGTAIRNVLVEDVRLERGYLRGAVEVSDGTDNVVVRRVYAEHAKYAVEQHDHGQKVPNTNVLIEDVTAVNCYAVMLGGDNRRGHKNLTLRRFTATNCKLPVKVAHIANVLIEDLTITNQTKADSPRIVLTDCQGVRLRNVKIKGLASGVEPVAAKGCSDVAVEKLTLADE